MKPEKEKLLQLSKNKEAAEELFKLFISATENARREALKSFNKNNCCAFIKIYYPGNSRAPFFFSESVKNVTGFSPGQLNELPGGFNSLILQDDISKVKNILSGIKEEKEKSVFEFQYRIKARDGKIVWLKEFITATRNNDGSVARLESYVFNINPFIEQEQSLIDLKNYYYQKNNAKDKFISIVSHDLRAPFTSLLGFSEILLKEPDLPEKERMEYLQYIYDAAKNQLELITDLLDWSRLQSGKIKLRFKRLNLKNVVSVFASLLTGTAINKEVEIKIDIPDDLYVLADERLFGEAISNLLSNSLKFTPRGKRIFVTANRFKKGVVELVIKDEGIGIPEEIQSKIFKIDEKISLQGTEGEKGSGLGLTLVKEIINKHNGEVWFYSRINEGTEFHITLPEAKTKIIVVEDDLNSRKLIKSLVNKHLKECEIIEASNGYEALNSINKELPSLLITDHEMPLMNGVQLIQAINKNSIDYLPVIVVSGKLTEDLTKSYKDLGVASIIQKPIDVNLFGDSLKRILFK